MRRTGIGLKPLIAVQLLVVIGTLVVLLTYAAMRLTRHEITMEEIRRTRLVLNETAAHLERNRPAGAHLESALRQAAYPSMLALSIYDPSGELNATTDARLAAHALWDAFGSPAAGGGAASDWAIHDADRRRLLVVSAPFSAPGWTLKGSFSLEESDRAVARTVRNLMLYAALLAFITILGGWVLLYRLMVRPVERLLQSSDRISEGDLAFLLSADRGSEFGRLGWSLSQMIRRIEQDQQRLKDQIAEQTRLNQELHQAQQGMIRSEKLASVGRLAAGLAHEVGNPISAILGYVNMLRTEQVPEEERRDILARVERETERIDKVIRDLLAYSRPGREAIQAVSPAELVEDAMILIRPQKKFKLLDFHIEVSPDLPMVWTDPDLTRQVLVNLVLNGMDAVSERGSIWLRAVQMSRDAGGNLLWSGSPQAPDFFGQGKIHSIRPPQDGKGLDPDKAAVVFTVVDDGPGIAASDLPRIFDPFFTSKEPGEGTGLGLAICHAGVTAMGGEIWAYSEVGRGTQLAFYLPVD